MDSKVRLVVSNTIKKKSSISFNEKQRDHNHLIEEYLLTRSLRNHTEQVIRESRRSLNNFFLSIDKFCWDVTSVDVKEYAEDLLDIGLAPSTRRGYISEIKMFYEFLKDHPTINDVTQGSSTIIQINQKYDVTISQPVDRWYIPRHVTDDHPQKAIPSKEQLRSFFAYLRYQINSAQKPHTLARDYALIRFLYHTGVRRQEASKIDLKDIRFDFGTVHVRFGKGTNGSGYRERYVPLCFGGIEEVLKIYLKEVRPKFIGSSTNPALFLSEAGRRIGNSTILKRLSEHIIAAQEEGIDIPLFTCHDLRRAFATHTYEEHPEKIELIRRMLGHWWLSTTQRYLRPSAQFILNQFTDITKQRLINLQRDDFNV